jgi:type I restriction enzyme S subunit
MSKAALNRYTPYLNFEKHDIDGLGKLPSHWEVKQVRYILKDGSEGIKIGPFGSALKLENMVDDGFRVYGQENVIRKDFSLGKRKISEEKYNEMSAYKVFPHDILITMMGTSGKCEIVPDEILEGIIDSHLLRVRVKPEYILTHRLDLKE